MAAAAFEDIEIAHFPELTAVYVSPSEERLKQTQPRMRLTETLYIYDGQKILVCQLSTC